MAKWTDVLLRAAQATRDGRYQAQRDRGTGQPRVDYCDVRLPEHDAAVMAAQQTAETSRPLTKPGPGWWPGAMAWKPPDSGRPGAGSGLEDGPIGYTTPPAPGQSDASVPSLERPRELRGPDRHGPAPAT
jgi:hypothetical protein